ncbi:MAG: hypothetical protein J5979_08515 [Lachnospiraceae bacterium]|nr:hypothetical protein [Lachnospiraceae bacterium]
MADYRLFPNEKRLELERECEDRKRQVDEAVKSRRNETEDKIKNNKKFKAFDISFGIFGMIILLVVPIMACSAACTAYGPNFVGLVAGFFAMVITGVIIYVIMMIIDIAMRRTKNKQDSALREQSEDDVEAIKKEKFTIEEEYRNKIGQYKKDFYEESDRRTAKFAGNPITEEITKWLGESFIDWIKDTYRGVHTNGVEVMYRFEVTEKEVIADICGNTDRTAESYVFLDHRIHNLADAAEAMALAKSIGTSLQTEILTEFPVDPSGIPVRVNAAYTDHDHRAIGSITYLAEREDLI